MFCARQPITENFEKTVVPDFGGRVQIFRKRAHRALVHLKEQTVLAAKMLEDGAFSDAEAGGNISDSRGVIPVLRKMQGRRFNDAAPLGFGTRTELCLSLVQGRCYTIAGDAGHR